MPSWASRSQVQEAARLCQEEDAMAAVTLQKEKDAADKDEHNATGKKQKKKCCGSGAKDRQQNHAQQSAHSGLPPFCA